MRRIWIVLPLAGIVLVGGVVATAPLWLHPIAESRASAALGRKVTIAHLGLALSPPRVTASGVVIVGAPSPPDVATIAQIVATLDLAPLVHGRMLNIPDIAITGMEIALVRAADGTRNDLFVLPASSGAAGPDIGAIHVADSRIHLVSGAPQADIVVDLHTEAETILGVASGTYQNQKVTGHLLAGALLALRSATQPYPIDIVLDNGSTHFTLAGTVENPLAFKGADVKVSLKGQDLAALYDLTGVPFPPTPPYDLTSMLGAEAGIMHLTNLNGRLGSSDLHGQLDITTNSPRIVLSGQLVSHRLDLEDISGTIGSKPGRVSTPGQTEEQKRAVAAAVADPRLIPNLPIDIPKIRSADFHVTFHGESISGRSVPFDTFAARIDIVDGHVMVTELRAGVGKGQLVGKVDMTPTQDSLHTVADIELQKLDVSRLLASTQLIRGSGTLGGQIKLDAVGKSLAEMLDNGTGQITFVMAGGSVSELVVDLSGLQLGNAVLAAIGLPTRAKILCLVGDLGLSRGALQTRSLLLDTVEDRVTVQGELNMRSETLSAQLRTRSKHFSVGTLPAPINISGTLKDPRFIPDIASVGLRAGSAVGLGLLFPPAALLPTIQLGIGEDNACVKLLREGQKQKG